MSSVTSSKPLLSRGLNEVSQTSQQKRKSDVHGKDDEDVFCLQPGLKWKLWLISNYEYERGSKTAISRIVSHSKSEKENSADGGISLKEFGVLVRMLWGDRILVARGPASRLPIRVKDET